MKRKLIVLGILCLLIAMLAVSVNAASESDLTFTLNDDGNSYSVTDCNESASGELVIPATYNGKPVTGIGNGAFGGCDSLTGVTISSGVTSIGDWAFDGCSSLRYNMYDNAMYLGNANNPYLALVKAYSTSITSCIIHKDTKFICSSAFANCSDLVSVTIPNGVASIGYSGFNNCSSLTSVIIPDSVISVGMWTFAGCYSLASVSIGNGIASIAPYMFCNCISLPSVTIPDGVINIETGSFEGCSNLTSITISGSVRYIGYMSLRYGGLETIIFKGAAPAFDEWAFWGVTATACYPAGNRTWTAAVRQNYGGEITWLAYEPENEGPSYNGLVEVNGVWGYYINGVLQTGYTGLVKHGDGYFYVQKGILDWSFFGIVYADGYYRYIENGMITWQYTGLASMNGEYYFVQNSTVNWDYTGLVEHNGTYYYIQNGHLDWSYYGLAYLDGYWRYIEGGMITWNYTGLAHMNGEWYYVENSTLDWSYTGLVEHNGMYYYVQNSHLDWSFWGLIYADGYWRYIENGMLTWQYTGLAQMNGEYFYVVNSTLDWGYTGLIEHSGALYYIHSGHLDWSYIGLGYHQGSWLYIYGGMYMPGYYGLTYFNNAWFYVEDSRLTWNNFGLYDCDGTLYYLNYSQIDWAYSGIAEYQGKQYEVVGGIAVREVSSYTVTFTTKDHSLYRSNNRKIELTYTLATVSGGNSQVAGKVNQFLLGEYEKYKQDIVGMEEEFDYMYGSGTYYFTETGRVSYNDGNVLSLCYGMDWFMGGVYNWIPYGYTFDLTTGELAQLDELFSWSDTALLSQIKSEIREYLRENDLDDGYYNQEETINGYTLDSFAFYIDGNGELIICIPVYELSYGAAGSFEIPCGVYLDN